MREIFTDGKLVDLFGVANTTCGLCLYQREKHETHRHICKLFGVELVACQYKPELYRFGLCRESEWDAKRLPWWKRRWILMKQGFWKELGFWCQ
jgi:hypothetical protein